MGSFLALDSALIVFGTWVLWFRRTFQVRLPADRTAYVISMGIGATLGLGAFFLGADGWARPLAWFGTIGGLAFLALTATSAQDAKVPSVNVGSPILNFTAPDENGDAFDLASMAGRPFLLKFFRGHW